MKDSEYIWTANEHKNYIWGVWLLKFIAICIVLFIIISAIIIFIIYADIILAFVVKMWDYVINAYDYAI